MAVSNLTTPQSGTLPNWTLIASSSGNNASSVTFSNISGYNTLRLFGTGLYNTLSQDSGAHIRLNGDTNLRYGRAHFYKNTSQPALPIYDIANRLGYYLMGLEFIASNGSGEVRRGVIDFTIENANNSENIKPLKHQAYFINSSATPVYQEGVGNYRSTGAPISSITIEMLSGNFADMTAPYGFFLYGAN